MQIRHFALMLVLCAGCPSGPIVTGETDASVTSDGGSNDAGVVGPSDQIGQIVPGAPYSLSQSMAVGVEAVSSESRFWLTQRDAGVIVVDRPTDPEANDVDTVSRDHQYLYARAGFSGVWRTSDGSRSVNANDVSEQSVVGETSTGAVVVASTGYSQRLEVDVVPLDGSAKRVFASGSVETTALLPSNRLLFVSDGGLWSADLGTTSAPAMVDPRAVTNVYAVKNRSAAFVTTSVSAQSYWVDFSAASPNIVEFATRQYPFLTPQNDLGRLRVDPNAKTLNLKFTFDGGVEQIVETAPGPIGIQSVSIETGIAMWTETVDSVDRAYVAELKMPFEPVALPKLQYGAVVSAEGSRVAYIPFSDSPSGVLEVNFAAPTVVPTIVTASQFAIRDTSLVFQDPTSGHLTLKYAGGARTELTTQPCWVLPGSGAVAVHQCADHAVYFVDAADRSVKIVGAEVDGNPYTFAVSGDLVRYFEDRLSTRFGGGHGWLYQVSTGQMLLSETEQHFYKYRLGGTHYVRGVGDVQNPGNIMSFDPATKTDQPLSPDGEVTGSLFPLPNQRDGGAHFATERSLADGGSKVRLFDLAAGIEVAVVDGGEGLHYAGAINLDRFYCSINDGTGKPKLLESATGQVVATPKMTDGGVESFTREVVGGKTRYYGDYGVYDDSFKPIFGIGGSKQALVDRTAATTYFTASSQLKDGGTAIKAFSVADDGSIGATKAIFVQASTPYVSAASDDGYFLVQTPSTDGGVINTYQPSTDTTVARAPGNLGSPTVFRGGFLIIGENDVRAYKYSETSEHIIRQAPERVLGTLLNVASNRLLVRSTTAGWRNIKLAVYDLSTMTETVVFQSDGSTKVGAFTFTADGAKVIYTTSAWDGSSSKTTVLAL